MDYTGAMPAGGPDSRAASPASELPLLKNRFSVRRPVLLTVLPEIPSDIDTAIL